MTGRDRMLGSKRPTAASVVGAAFLSLVVAGQGLGATWTQEPVTAWGNWPSDLVSLGGSTALVAFTKQDTYEDTPSVFVKRSTNSGATWGSRVMLSATGTDAQLATRGQYVDAVFRQEGSVVYRRSTDAGLTFGSPIVIAGLPTDPDAFLIDLDVARGPQGLVVVMWAVVKWVGIQDDEDIYRTTIRTRASTDGGRSFGAPVVVARPAIEEGAASVAVGAGVIYVAYIGGAEVRVKRSRTGGATWSAPTVIGPAFDDRGAAVVAEGRNAYVTFSTYDRGKSSIRYRRTTDKGATWSSRLVISSVAGTQAHGEVLSLENGVLRAAYDRCDLDCDVEAEEGIYFRESRDGVTWTKAQLVRPKGSIAVPVAVGYTGSVLVLYRDVALDDIGFVSGIRGVVAVGTP